MFYISLLNFIIAKVLKICYILKIKEISETYLFYGADGRGRTGTRVEPHKILSLARLPIPSHRLI